jgi:hypothetical protein
MMSKHYSKEFRLQTARLVVEKAYTYAEAAQRLGPPAWSVRGWGLPDYRFSIDEGRLGGCDGHDGLKGQYGQGVNVESKSR